MPRPYMFSDNHEPDYKPQMALAALLEENARAELRANELQRRLEQTSGAVRGAEERAEALKNELEESRHGAIGIRALASSAAATAHSRDAKKPSKALADTAAEARAAAAEAALSKALEAVEELESRCAQAQAREREVERKSAAQMEVLKREWEEATSNGPKASSRKYSLAVMQFPLTLSPHAGGKQARDGVDWGHEVPVMCGM